MLLPSPTTLTKVATKLEDIEINLFKYSSGFNRVHWGRKQIEKWTLYHKGLAEYALTVSQNRYGPIDPEKGNVTVTVTSRFPSINEQVCKDLAEKVGLDLRDAPGWFSEDMARAGNEAFLIFERDGQKAEDYVANLDNEV